MKSTIICGHQGAGKTQLGFSLFTAHRGPRLKTHIDTRSKVVQQQEGKENTLLWVDECHSIINTIESAKELGYRSLILGTQIEAARVRQIIESYGLPEGDYHVIDLTYVPIQKVA